jgi:polyvinyl alcohol dehydrogenase (cytochrome)
VMVRFVGPRACWAALVAAVCGAAFVAILSSNVTAQVPALENAAAAPAVWQLAGANLTNTRHQANESIINAANVQNLKVKWTFVTGGDVSATPTVSGNAVYAPDWAGNLFAINKDTGTKIWQHQISEYDGMSNSMARVSPLVLENEIIIGDNVFKIGARTGAYVMALNPASGALLWITRVEEHPAAVITGSPVAYKGIIYVGVASTEEGAANTVGYDCCTFRGSMVALNAETGQIIWKTYTVPDNHGASGAYSGGAIWQPPAIDSVRGLLYVGTGNNYDVPQSVEDCEVRALAEHNPYIDACTPQADHFDSALAIDLLTGKVKWYRKFRSYDAWTVACFAPRPGVTCPSPTGPDYDFSGSGPNLLWNLVGFGGKSGIYSALNPDNGAILWSTMVGPAGSLGGIQWGTAADATRIYVPIGNNRKTSYTLSPNGPTITWGSWAALSSQSGKILWQTADPTQGAFDPGAASVANDVVYAGSTSGFMYALDAKTGTVLWSFASGGSVMDGPAIVDGVVYWGSGYKKQAPGTGNNKLYAFSLQ